MAFDLVDRAGKPLAVCRIDKLIALVLIDVGDQPRHRIDNGAQLFFAATQGFFGPFAFGDIGRNANNGVRFTGRIEQGRFDSRIDAHFPITRHRFFD